LAGFGGTFGGDFLDIGAEDLLHSAGVSGVGLTQCHFGGFGTVRVHVCVFTSFKRWKFYIWHVIFDLFWFDFLFTYQKTPVEATDFLIN
jgi:hypothetical protein